jgi:hypothetical protein
MLRSPGSVQLDLADVFLRVQAKMLADLTISGVFTHPTANGTATEHIWVAILNRYLPNHYRAAPAFVINSAGRRSRQIDIAIFDNVRSTPLFPHASGDHVPVESVYAALEVKPAISKQWLEDAAEKVASVRELRTTNRKILGGLVGTSSVWHAKTFPANLRRTLASLPPSGRIDIGCALDQGAFEHDQSINISQPNRAFMFFLLRLITRLNALGPAPEADLADYLNRAR